jgi:uncharacterized membrane protein YhaH (DUF805 family)
MSWRRRVLGVWALLSVIWAGYVLAQSPFYAGYGVDRAVFAFLPSALSLPAGFIFKWLWQAQANSYWLKVPQHLRRGLLRLYLVLSVPWVAWFALQILANGPRWRNLSHAFLLLLIVPIGEPVVLFVISWVVAGFQKTGTTFENSRSTSDESPEPAAHSSPEDYYDLISRAVKKLPTNDYHARQEMYRRAKELLHNQLHGQGRSYTKAEWRALEHAIRKAEAESAAQERNRRRLEPQSTGLLVTSIFFPSLWATDVTSMSLYWVARLQKLYKSAHEPVHLFKLLFSFSGRLNRAKYWLGIGIVFGAGAGITGVLRVSAERTWWLPITAALLIAWYVSFAAIITKRLHDLNLSVWWGFGFFIAVFATGRIFSLAQLPPYIELLLLVGAIWLGSAKGSETKNQFGPPSIA